MTLAAGGFIEGPVTFYPLVEEGSPGYVIPNSALKVYDIDQYITGMSWEPTPQEGDDRIVDSFYAKTITFELTNIGNGWYNILYGYHPPNYSKMHADYRRKTRRRNRRR